MTPHFILLTQLLDVSFWVHGEGGHQASRLTWINPAVIAQMTRRGEDKFTELYLGNTHINVAEAPAEIMTKIINAPKGTDLDAGSEIAARQA